MITYRVWYTKPLNPTPTDTAEMFADTLAHTVGGEVMSVECRGLYRTDIFMIRVFSEASARALESELVRARQIDRFEEIYQCKTA